MHVLPSLLALALGVAVLPLCGVAPDLRKTAGYSLDARDNVLALLENTGWSRHKVAKALNKSWTFVDYVVQKHARNGTTVSDFERGIGRTGRRSERTEQSDHFLVTTP